MHSRSLRPQSHKQRPAARRSIAQRKAPVRSSAVRSIHTTRKAARQHSTPTSLPRSSFALSTISSSSSSPSSHALSFSPSFQPCLMTQQSRFFHASRPLRDEEQPAAIDNIAPEVSKIVDDILKLNIMQVLQLTKVLKKEFGYNDAAFAVAAPVAVAGGAAAAEEEAAPVAAAKTIFNVKLDSFDAASKVKIIKEVRTITGLGLKEAKELVEGAPQILKKEVKKEEGDKLIEQMKAVGAVCILE